MDTDWEPPGGIVPLCQLDVKPLGPVIPVMVSVAFPPFVIVKVAVLLAPTTTSPNVKFPLSPMIRVVGAGGAGGGVGALGLERPQDIRLKRTQGIQAPRRKNAVRFTDLPPFSLGHSSTLGGRAAWILPQPRTVAKADRR